MEYVQIAELVNSASAQMQGDLPVLQEDLSNVVELGEALRTTEGYDVLTKNLIDRIGYVEIVNRVYKGKAPAIKRLDWEFGAILQKISGEMPEASVNMTWELENGASYDPFVFVAPKALEKFYKGKKGYEIRTSRSDKVLRTAFTSPEKLAAFVSMLDNQVQKAITINEDAIIMWIVDSLIGETLLNEISDFSQLAGVTGVKAINLKTLMKQNIDPSYDKTFNQALFDPEFIRHATYQMWLTAGLLEDNNTVFNIGKQERFTPRELLHFVRLADFDKAAGIYLQSDVYHNSLTQLPYAETVNKWQGIGDSTNAFSLADRSKINIVAPSGQEVELGGIIGVMFDHDAAVYANKDSRVTSQYNASNETTNFFYKEDGNYLIDTNEQCVVFYYA